MSKKSTTGIDDTVHDCVDRCYAVVVMRCALIFALVLLVHDVSLALPPLSVEQQLRLETAYDGRDHREEAFIALLEHVRQWESSELGSEAVILQPDVEALLADPESHRGSLVQIVGRLEQRSDLEKTYSDVQEWFVRLASGRPIAVFVVGVSDDENWSEGQQVGMYSRFYKRIDAVDRQGQSRQYAAFVAAHPWQVTQQQQSVMGQLWLPAGLVLILLGAFLLLVIAARRARRRSGLLRRGFADEALLDEAGDLPDDPAAALAELKRRAARQAR